MYARFATWVTSLRTALEELRTRDEGQGLVEYALILVLVSVVCIAVLAALGVKISGVFQQITDTI